MIVPTIENSNCDVFILFEHTHTHHTHHTYTHPTNRDCANNDLEVLKTKFLNSLKARGSTSVSELAGNFRSITKSGGVQLKYLSFAEFNKAYRDLG